MPVERDCPICGFRGYHGFRPVNGGMYYYHGSGTDSCWFYEGTDGKIYKTGLELFEAVVVPNTKKDKASCIWIEARRADLSNQPRKAKRLYKKWKEEMGIL